MSDVTTFESRFETSPTQRLDVIPAGPVRRSWPEETRARIVAESMAVGANVSDVARRNGILPQQLYAWRRQAKEKMEAGDGMAFVPAMIAEAPTIAASGNAEIRIELAGMIVRVPEAASADHLERVLLAIQVST